jgi:hypothetical protein
MQLNHRARYVLLWFLTVAVIACSLWVIHRKTGWSLVPLQGLWTQERHPAPAAANSSNTYPLTPAEFASAARDTINQLDGAVTLTQWKTLHSGEKSSQSKGFECLSLEKADTLPSGGQVLRRAYFYPPPAPSPAILPTWSGQELMDRACTLAIIWMETPAPSPEAGHALAEAVELEFTKKYGEPRRDLIGVQNYGFQGSGAWKEVAWWLAGDTQIVSSYKVVPADPVHTGIHFVYAQLPIVRILDNEACCTLKAYRHSFIEKSEFDQAIVLSGVDAALSERMEKVYDEVCSANTSSRADWPSSPYWHETLVPLLRDWIKSLKTLPSAQRAAGLFAADRLLAAAGDISRDELRDPNRTETRSELQELGAEFEFSEIDNSYYYTVNWLKQARELDLDGKVGQLAVVVSLARGFSGWTIPCEEEAFRKVISDGESLLARGLDATTASQVHFMVGDAFADIVAQAGGANPDVGDIARYRAEADSAKVKALDHYRAGLAVDNISENAKDAWRQAWRLSAGLSPGTRYVCVGD